MAAKKSPRKKASGRKKRPTRRTSKRRGTDEPADAMTTEAPVLRDGSVGRPRYEFDRDTLARMIQLGMSIEGCADLFRVNPSTLKKHIAENPELDAVVAEARAQRSVNTLANLQRHARTNVAAAIFLGKNWCGLRDFKSVEVSGPDGAAIGIDHSHDLDAELSEKLSQWITKHRREQGEASA